MFIRRYRTELLIALVALAIAACFFPIRMRFPFDDTYITFRYAENVAHGFGIVWNTPTLTQPIGPHTEGYTNFLFMLLLVPFVWMGLDLVVVAQAIGVVATGVSAIAIYRIMANGQWVMSNRAERQTKENTIPLAIGCLPLGVWLAVALFLFDPFTWMNAYSGLETSLFTMWLLCAIWAFALERIELAFALSSLAALTRPEGALMGMVLLIAGIMRARYSGIARDPEKASAFSYWLSAFVLPLALYAGWKWWYFGNLFPNSFYVKVAQPVGSTLAGFTPGRGTLRIFYEHAWYLLPLAIAACWKRWKDSVVQTAVLWCVLLSGFYLFSLLIQNEYDRFMYPVESFLILLMGIGFASLFERVSKQWIVCVAMGIVIFIGIFWPIQFRYGAGYIRRTSEETNPYRHVADVFRSIPDSHSIMLAWGDAGRLPYYSGLRWIDPVGLNTNAIAHAHTASEVVTDILAERPDMIIIPLVRPQDEFPKRNDSSRMVLPHGHGLIGSAYARLAQAALTDGYRPIALMPQTIYDLDLLADTSSIHYFDIQHTIEALMGKDSNFRAPAMRMY